MRNSSEIKSFISRLLALGNPILLSFKRYPHFFIISFLGFLINILITKFLTDFTGLFYVFSYILGTLGNWTFNFVFHSKVTFSNHNKEKQALRYCQFLVFYGIVAILNFSTVYLLTSIIGIYYLVSIVLVTFIYSFFTFTILRKRIFAS